MAIGNPVSTTSSSVASKTSSVIATAGQTLFTVPAGYVTNHISVFRNGIRLVDGRDYEARNGATVTLLAAATVGDVIEFHVFDTFSVADAVTNQGGTIFGDLTVEGSIGDITANNVTGVAATFTGAVSVGGVLTYEDVTNIDSVGIITARSDLSIADKIIHTGDTNTAIRFPAADTITAETAGSERLRIDSSGRMGLGTASPSNILSLDDTQASGGVGIDITNQGDGGTSTTPYVFINAKLNPARSGGEIRFGREGTYGSAATADSFMAFYTAVDSVNTERLRIDSSGRMGLGTNSPGHNLEIKGSFPDFAISDSDTVNDKLRILYNGGGTQIQVDPNNVGPNASYFLVSIDNTERMRIDSSGRMGLGTSSPVQPLDIVTSGADAYIRQSNGTVTGFVGVNNNNSAFDIYTFSNHPTRFFTNNTERMRIDTSGRLLVGTSSSSSNNSVVIEGYSGSGTGQGIVTLARGSSTPADGNVLGALEFTDSGHIASASVIGRRDGGTWTSSSSQPSRLVFSTTADGSASPTERLRIDSSGRLLLGTTTEGQSDADNFTIEDSGDCGISIRSGTTNAGAIYFSDGTSGNSEYRGYVEYNQSSDFLRFGSASAERMRIDSSGNMGLGTASPSWILSIKRDSSSAGTGQYPAVQINNTNSSGYAALYLNDSTALTGLETRRDTSHLGMYAGGSEQMRLDSSGRLLVGTSSEPGSGEPSYSKLIVGGSTNNTTDSGRVTLMRGVATASMANNSGVGKIDFSSNTGDSFATINVDVDGTTGSGDAPGRLVFSTTADGASSPTERMRITSGGNIQITDPNNSTGLKSKISFVSESPYQDEVAYIGFNRTATSGAPCDIVFNTGTASGTDERMRIDSSGAVTVKRASTFTTGLQHGLAIQQGSATNGNRAGLVFKSLDGFSVAGINGVISTHSGTQNNNVGYLEFYTKTSGVSAAEERMRIRADGNVLIGKTSTGNDVTGVAWHYNSLANAYLAITNNASGSTNRVVLINRNNADGTLIEFRGQNTKEGEITVNGGTVAIVGGHLSRWSQTLTVDEHSNLLKGTVLTNLDEMCEWEGEDNEQLNKMAVSSVEGDPNVAGVINYIDDDNDLIVSMTGDMIIRIAQGTTVARGDLLMSAGDGTAKPQDDDIVRSKTIAKVTSTTVSTTYSDGSYCVPCVLMAC